MNPPPSQLSGTRVPGARSAFLEAVRRHASERPDAEAVGEVVGDGVVGGRSCSYGELARLVDERSRLLASWVEPGERGSGRVGGGGEVVIAVLPSGVEFVAWFCAAIASGVRLLPMHSQIAGPEALAVAERAGAVAAVVAPGMTAGPALAHLARPVDFVQGREASGRVGAIVLGSSGTTGLPKLALRDGASLDADAAGVVAGLGLTAADRVVFATPLSHSYGVDVLVGVLMAGAAMRVLPQFDADVLAQELESGTGAILPAVPFIFEALARRTPSATGLIRLAVSAGSPLPWRVREEFRVSWGVEVGQLYGATELGTVAIDAPGSAGYDASSVGRPLAGVSMRAVDVDDPARMLKPGEEGQLAVRAGSMLTGYLDGVTPLVDGHFLTGDLARVGLDGRVWITGRLKQLIDVGAYKVNPLEVEGVLATHPGVAECAVVPVAASETVQRLRAVVVARRPDSPPAAEELRRFLRERLSPIKVPRVVEFVPSLPKSATGKVLRDRL